MEPTQSPFVQTLVFVSTPDKPGELGKLARVCANEGINIEGFNCFGGGVHLLTSNPTDTVDTLRAAGYRPQAIESLAVRLPNQPGQLAVLGEELGKAGVNIENCFAVGGTRESGRIFLRVSDTRKALPVVEKLATVQTTSGGASRPVVGNAR